MSKAYVSLNPIDPNLFKEGDRWIRLDPESSEQEKFYKLFQYFIQPRNQGQTVNAVGLDGLSDILRRVQHRILHMLGTYEDSLLGTEAFLKNIYQIASTPNISQYSTKATRAIYISAGPSAGNEEDIRIIRRLHKDSKALILCCDIMYDWCVSKQIIPDIVVSTERTEGAIYSLSELTPKTLLVCSEVVPNELFRYAQKKAFILRTSSAVQWATSFLTNHTPVNCGVSVGAAAVATAHQLGIKQLWMYGFDCSIEKDATTTHCNYNVRNIDYFTKYGSELINSDFYEADGLKSKVLTSDTWKHFQDTCLDYAKTNQMMLVQTAANPLFSEQYFHCKISQFKEDTSTLRFDQEKPESDFDKKLESKLLELREEIECLLDKDYSYWKTLEPESLEFNQGFFKLAHHILVRDLFIYESMKFEGSEPLERLREIFGMKVRSAVFDVSRAVFKTMKPQKIEAIA